jgi:hypothetical protein
VRWSLATFQPVTGKAVDWRRTGPATIFQAGSQPESEAAHARCQLPGVKAPTRGRRVGHGGDESGLWQAVDPSYFPKQR